MKLMPALKVSFSACALGVVLATSVHAEELLKPFLAAPDQQGDLRAVGDQLKKKLKESGFVVVGDYVPYDKVRVLAVTSDALKKTAAKTDRGAYGAVMRVSLADAGGMVQVTCTNPAYLAAAYHLSDALDKTSESLDKAIGCKEPFGANGMSAKDLANYNYAVGMEYFEDVYDLGKFGGFEEAVKTIEANLADKKGGVEKVYRVDIPGRQQVLFGVAMRTEAAGGDKYADDAFQMGMVDVEPRKRAAYLPYEILVSGHKAEALHMRYRMALYFPDLSMMGSGPSFFKLKSSPDAVLQALRKASGGKVEEPTQAAVWGAPGS
ncbi:MAG: hypothetical protein ACP5OY_08730 [Halothiobacillaceae bacterium]